LIIRITLKLKVADETTDKEIVDIYKKYIDVMTPKSVRFSKYPDSLGWIA